MKTVLDEGYTWFLDALLYRDSQLVIVVVEGFRASEPESMEVPGVGLLDARPIEPAPHSRRVAIRFRRPVAWQHVDESWTAGDEYEQHEGDGKLRVLTRSRYMDYVNASHGWFADIVGPAKHYRVWTENDVIEIVSSDPPMIETIPPE